MKKKINLKRVVMEVFGGCNYTCTMCPQSNPGRGKSWTRKMPLAQFEKILDEVVRDFGNPQINLEGSGEPTMAKDLPQYIAAVKKRNLRCFMYCNGARLKDQFMRDVIDSGIDFIRVSIIGYNKEIYKKWMNIDNFDLILKNILDMKKYINETKSKCLLSTYHLITNNQKTEEEIDLYKENVINKLDVISYIWKMHNWSGNYNNINLRNSTKKRSCGRPFAPELTVRAGGETGRTGAVVPCCQTLGPPNEEKSILGHLDKSSLQEIYFGEKYNKLRDAHEKKEFDRIDYCKNCDFLYDDPEVIAWTNDPDHKINHMLGTDDNFILTEFTDSSSVYK